MESNMNSQINQEALKKHLIEQVQKIHKVRRAVYHTIDNVQTPEEYQLLWDLYCIPGSSFDKQPTLFGMQMVLNDAAADAIHTVRCFLGEDVADQVIAELPKL